MSLVTDTLEYLRNNGYPKAKMNGYYSIIVSDTTPNIVSNILNPCIGTDIVITKEQSNVMIRLYTSKNVTELGQIIAVDLPSRLILYKLLDNPNIITKLSDVIKLLNISVSDMSVSWYNGNIRFVTNILANEIDDVNHILQEHNIIELRAIDYLNSLTFVAA